MNEESNIKFALFLEDILHTGNHGPEDKSKVGEKYDRRRDTYCRIDPISPIHKDSVTIVHYSNLEDWKNFDTDFYTFTTPLVSLDEEKDYVILRTINSVYRFKKVFLDQ